MFSLFLCFVLCLDSSCFCCFFFFQAEDGIRDFCLSRGLGDVYKRQVDEDQAKLINDTKKNGGRVICVGTTSCRTLESAAGDDGILKAGSGWTDIFIYPGYRFKAMDALITNFHLPESTLVMLVSAFASREKILNAYNIAVQERYRFFSFGDAMYIY